MFFFFSFDNDVSFTERWTYVNTDIFSEINPEISNLSFNQFASLETQFHIERLISSTVVSIPFSDLVVGRFNSPPPPPAKKKNSFAFESHLL